MTDQGGPPVLSRALLRLLPAVDRDEIDADMAELFAARVASTGGRAARRWYRVHALRLVLTLRWDQMLHGQPVPDRGERARAPRIGGGLQLVQDLRYVMRTLRRSPGFAATVILTLAVGIGATTAIFSVADAALFRPVLYPNPDRLVRIYLEPEETSSGGFVLVEGRRMVNPSAWDLKHWQTTASSFDGVATFAGTSASFFSAPPEVERLSARAISPDYLRVYGIQPFLGRAFVSQDHEPNAPAVVMVGYRFWRDRLGGDRAVLGSVIRFEEGDARVVGVVPPSLSPAVAVWRPMSASAMDPPKPTGLPVTARLKPGVTLAEAQTELSAITPADNPMRPRRGAAAPVLTPEVRATQGPTIWILLGAVGCVLLIACVNVAGLQFARGLSRQQELVIRSALGAGRWRLFRLVMTESLLVAVAGGLLGVVLAWLTLDGLLAILPIQFFQRPVAVDRVVLAAAGAISIGSGLVFGLLPAIRLSAVGLGRRSVRIGSGQRSTAATRRTGSVLVAGEVALALVLLAGSTLMIRTLIEVHRVDLGFDPDRFVAMYATPLGGTREVADGGSMGGARVGGPRPVQDRARLDAFYMTLLDRVRRLPGVTMAGAVTGLPLGGAYSRGADLSYLDGRPTTEPENGWDTRGFTPGYFDTIGMRRVAGQWPSDADCAATPRPLVLNESAARRIFGAAPAVGQLLISRKEVHRVLAVAGDVRHSGPLEETVSEVYFCRGNPGAPGTTTAVVVRTERPFAELAAQLRGTVLGTGERVTEIRIQRGDELFAERTALPRHRTQLLTILGALGLLLAMVGVFGMTAYAVARRTREVGIRMAFGARPVDAVAAIVRDVAVPGAIGMALGLVGAYWSAPVLSTFLFQTSPRDPWAFGAAVLALTLAGLLAAWIPARRAATVNPVEALRAE